MIYSYYDKYYLNKEISDDVDKKVELVNNIIKPHLRQAKLNKLGV